MEIEFRLSRLLSEHGLYKRGIANDLAKALRVHRHTAADLLSERPKGLSLDRLSELCTWLERQGVPAKELPRGLFGVAAQKLWRAVAKTKNVWLYLGEYQEVSKSAPGPMQFWVSRRDSVMANAVTQELYTGRERHDRGPKLHTGYVPFRFETASTASTGTTGDALREDKDRARAIFENMATRKSDASAILIGSQQVNYLVEVFVADLFRCKPFESPLDEARVPFHMVFRNQFTNVRSCFGSLESPPGADRKLQPGLYYRDGKGDWVGCPLVKDKQDSGLVITINDPSMNVVEVVMFGFTGRATAAMATHVVPQPARFWPPYLKHGKRYVGVYLCRFNVAGDDEDDPQTYQVKKWDVDRLEESVLKKYLRPGETE